MLESVPDRLPETVTAIPPESGPLMIRLGSFGQRTSAERQRARVGGFGARIEQRREGRSVVYTVWIGPLADVAEADRTLPQVIGVGVPDARIVVE